jgi:hypothetical protein
MGLVEWLWGLSPDQVVLFALPFFVAAAGLVSDRWQRLHGSPKERSRGPGHVTGASH